MAEITVNGLRATLCALTLPRFGAWVADVDVDSAEAITGAVAHVKVCAEAAREARGRGKSAAAIGDVEKTVLITSAFAFCRSVSATLSVGPSRWM